MHSTRKTFCHIISTSYTQLKGVATGALHHGVITNEKPFQGSLSGCFEPSQPLGVTLGLALSYDDNQEGVYIYVRGCCE